MCVKVFLGSNGEVEEYSVTSIQENAAISSDLILDQKEEHLFIMTHNKVWLPTNVLLGQLFWKDSDLPFLLSVLILTFFFCHVCSCRKGQWPNVSSTWTATPACWPMTPTVAGVS